MGVLGKLNEAIFTVPLILSSLLLRALGTKRKGGTRPAQRRGRRGTPAASAQAPMAVPRKRSSADVKGMHRELADVLDAHEGSREVFRYLAHFESRFAKKGLHTLDEMSVKRLRRALAQFEAIVTNWSSTNLADLRSRMAVAVSLRDSGAAMWTPAQTISKAYIPPAMPLVARGGVRRGPDFEGSRQVEVEDDVSISRFEAAGGEWPTSQHQALAVAGGRAPSPAR